MFPPIHPELRYHNYGSFLWRRLGASCRAVAVELTLSTPGAALRTGALVLHVDETSFSLLTLEGHLQAGWITFAARDDGGVAVAEVRSLARSGDPLYEAGFLVAGHHQQDEFWHRTLENLGAHFGVRGLAFTRSAWVDPRRQWRQAANALHNAGLRSAFEAVAGLASRVLHPRMTYKSDI